MNHLHTRENNRQPKCEGNSARTRAFLEWAWIVLLFALVSCGTPLPPGPTETPDGANAIIEISEDIESMRTTLAREARSQPNCNGVSEIENIVTKSHTVVHTAVVDSEYQLSSDGTLGIGGTGIRFGHAVAARLGYSYGTEVEAEDAVVVKAAPGTHMEHVIRTDEVWQAGTVKITLMDKEYHLPFRFRTGFIVEVEESRPLICPLGNEPVPSNTPYFLVTNTPAPLPTARIITLTPTTVPENQDSGSQGEGEPTSNPGQVVPSTSLPPTVPTLTRAPIPPTSLPIPPTFTIAPPTSTSVPPTLTLVPPTLTSEPTVAPSMNFQWDVNAVCDGPHDFVQVRMRNDNPVAVEISGKIWAQPDGGSEAAIAEVPGPYEICPAGGWCGPIANIRVNLSPSGSGRVWGSASVYYQGVEVSSNSIDVHIACSD